MHAITIEMLQTIQVLLLDSLPFFISNNMIVWIHSAPSRREFENLFNFRVDQNGISESWCVCWRARVYVCVRLLRVNPYPPTPPQPFTCVYLEQTLGM